MSSDPEKPANNPTFGPFPSKGIWTAVGLSRAAFLTIFLGASALYMFWGGPLWSHLGEDDFARIIVSYSIIPIAVAIALLWDGSFAIANFIGATAVIAALKFVLTALLALIFDLEALR